MRIFHEKVDLTSYKCWLEIKKPNLDNVGPYKCMIKGDSSQLTANLNLDIEDEPESHEDKAIAPKFLEKPKIVIMNEGNLAQLIVCYKAQSKCSYNWYYKEKLIKQEATKSVYHEKIGA